MKIKKLAIGLALGLLCTNAGQLFGQNELDAYRLMSPTTIGTARALGMAGAFSAVGADFTATSLNPAGLALYRRSEFMFTPAVRLNTNTSTYLDQTEANTYGKFGFSNVGYVYADRVATWDRETRTRVESEKGFRSYGFSLGFNQIGQYGRNTKVTAYNTRSSISEYFASLANGTASAAVEQEDSYAGQAWWAYLIDTSGSDVNYVGAADGGNVEQTVEIDEIGRNNEWSIGFAGNLEDRIYMGASLGIQNISYQTAMTFKEEDINNLHNTFANDSTPFQSGTFTTGFRTRGSGFNLRLGIIGKPTDYLRVGVSVVTPTVLALTDTYYSQITGNLDDDPIEYTTDAPDGRFSYKFVNPFKVTVGGMALLGKRGFISADFDYIDYTNAKYKSDVSPSSSFYYNFRDENNSIQDLFSGAYNLRLGGELRFGPGRARLGYGRYTSILKKEFLNYYTYPDNTVQKLRDGKQVYTLGLGLKQKSFYLDLAFVHEEASDRRLLYTLPDATAYSPELVNKLSSNNIYMTIGFTF